MKKIIYVLLILFCCNNAYSIAESSYVDSILTKIPNIKYDSNRIKAYLKLSTYYHVKDFDKAMFYVDKASAISKSDNDKAKCLYNKGKIYSRNSKWVQSDSCLMASKKIYTSLNKISDIAFCYQYLGFNGYYQGNYLIAIKNYVSSLKLCEKLGEKERQMKMLMNIGTVYKEQDELEKALDYYLQAQDISEEVDDLKFEASLLNNIGIIYKQKDNPDKALANYQSALKLFQQIDERVWEANTYNNIAIIYDEKSEFPKAKLYYNKALKMFEEEEYDYGIILSSTNLAEMMNDLGDYDSAIRYAQISLTSASKLELKDDMRYAYKSLSRSYKEKGNYSLAYNFYVLYSEIKDSIFNEEKLRQANEIEAIYESEKKELEIENLENEKKLQEVELAISHEQEQKQKLVSYSIAGGLALVIIFSIIVLNRLQLTRKQKKIIENQKQEVEEQKKLVDEKNMEITDSITYAKRIQDAILPSKREFKKHLKNGFVYYQPKDIVAGDFYWMEKIENEIFFAAADCTGHGVPGAMVSVVCHNALNRAVREFNLTKPSEILDKVRLLVIETFEKSDKDVNDGMDIALCCLNTETRELQYAGANNSLYIISEGKLTEIRADKQPVGKYIKPKPFSNNKMQLKNDDTIYIFSDGYADQFGGVKGKKFMYKPFRKLLLSIQDELMDEQGKIIKRTFNNWKGNLYQIDDVCIIGVRI